MLAAVRSATLLGIDGQVVTVEVHVSNGLPGYTVVGLPDTAVRESRERVRAALLSSELSWPLKRVTVNLAPSGVRKTGAGLDLAFALGLMLATGELPSGVLDGIGVLGELGLDGRVRAVPGALALVSALSSSAGVGTVIVPSTNATEACLVEDVRVLPAQSLLQLRSALKGEEEWPAPPVDAHSCATNTAGNSSACSDEACADQPRAQDLEDLADLADVRGLSTARRALEAAAAGGHHLLLVGPPGCGKTMLARRLPGILPAPPRDEALEVTRIHSAAGLTVGRGLLALRPFRAPHHTISTAALVGGGSGRPNPGEVTLAHRGALFLDELGEFSPKTLDALRQPLEERSVRIARQPVSLTFPSNFVLIACSNPCPCGLGPPRCRCDESRLARYRRRLSAPLLDRFHLRLAVAPTSPLDPAGPPTSEVRARVNAAVERQSTRYKGMRWRVNAQVPTGEASASMTLGSAAEDALHSLALRAAWTGRGMAIIQRVARTLADLDDTHEVDAPHVALAASWRQDVL